MSISKQIRTRLLIFTLFGDYIFPREGWAPTAGLITLLRRLGVHSPAARSTLSRMSRQGWLRAERRGRHSLYGLTMKGRHLLEEGTHRIFEPQPKNWDGQWRVVVYSLPEQKRRLRGALRRRLSYLGFGALAPGTWISPHDRQIELEALLDDLNARPYVQCFVGKWLGQLSNEDLVARCWNLDGLNRQYAAFVRKWEPKLKKQRRGFSKKNGMKPGDCFVHRFWIIHEYSAFPSRDPNLPGGLLPQGWMGSRAGRVFRGYRELLTGRANAFVEEMLETRNGYVFDKSS